MGGNLGEGQDSGHIFHCRTVGGGRAHLVLLRSGFRSQKPGGVALVPLGLGVEVRGHIVCLYVMVG